jgi:hypothetical protein
LNSTKHGRLNTTQQSAGGGAEIEFPPALDDVFGVTNNKQYARNFAELAKIKIGDLLEGGKTIHNLIQEWEENGDPRAPLLQIAQVIESNIGILRGMLEKSQKGVRAKKRHEKALIEEQATVATQWRKEAGHKGGSDLAEDAPTEQRIEALATEIGKEIADGGKPTKEQQHIAQEMAARIINNGLKYEIEEAEIEMEAFFSVKAVAGILRVTLNTGHPAYKYLVQVLDRNVENVPAEQLRERLQNASDGLRLLLTAWARYEDEQPDGRRREAVREARTDWGRVARQFYNTVANEN